MLARRVATIMPAMSEAKAVETTKIHSVCGLSTAGASFSCIAHFVSRTTQYPMRFS